MTTFMTGCTDHYSSILPPMTFNFELDLRSVNANQYTNV